MAKARFLLVMLMLTVGLAGVYAEVEVVHFDILLFGDKIGYLTATHEIKPDGSEFYTLDSWSKAKILWITHQNTTHYEVVYKNGKLISSKATQSESGELKVWNNVTYDGKEYHVDGYKGKRSFTEIPTFSVVTLYFKNMDHVKRMLYETEAELDDVQHPEANTWEFKTSDGNRNVYHFVNGRAKNIEVHASIATVKIVRVN